MGNADMSTWKWMPHAAHLIVSNQCQFHLATYLPSGYIVSTVGEYVPNGSDKFVSVGLGRMYETMVFHAHPSSDCRACGFAVTDYSEVDFHGYNDAYSASAGHMHMCEEWAAKERADDNWLDAVLDSVHLQAGVEVEPSERGELLTQVKTYLDDFQDTTGYDNHDMNRLGDTYAQSIIALVTAARDAEIREALESEELVGMFARMLWAQGDKPTAAPSSSYYMAARYNLDSIAKHIGLGDETGGQG